MAGTITIHSKNDLKIYKDRIYSNLDKSIGQVKQLLANDGALKIFQTFKFEKCVTEPLSGEKENLIEVINQSMTYIVSGGQG